MPFKYPLKSTFFLSILFALSVLFLRDEVRAAQAAGALFEVALMDGRPGVSWRFEEVIRKFATQTRREQAPEDHRVVSWKGILLSDAVKSAFDSLSAEQRAQVDLLILHGKGGKQGLLPRAFIQKYPILLAYERNGQPLGRLDSVVPWTTFAGKMRAEGAPLETFFVQGVERVEFASYRDRYGSFLLKRRTDPSAMRGEKIFVQNCTGCHTGGPGPSLKVLTQVEKGEALEKKGHPAGRGAPVLSGQEVRSLKNYLDAFRRENGVQGVGSDSRAGQGAKTALYAPSSS
jgi:hypothetical protein